MKELYFKQKISLVSKYDIFDMDENPVYHVAGHVGGMTFDLTKYEDEKVATIKKKISIVPKYVAEMASGKKVEINKKLAVVKQEFVATVDGKSLVSKGNFIAFDFEMTVDDQVVGKVNKELLHLTDTYKITVLDEQWMDIIVALAVCIDNAEHNNK